MQSASRKVAIIGGGISGLSAAHFLESLAPEGTSIELFEAADRLGGKIQTVQKDGLTMELGAESFLSRKQPGIDLCSELNISDQLRGTRPENKKTYVWYDQRLHRLPEGLSGFVPGKLSALKSTTLLNTAGKLRVGLDYLLPASRKPGDESLANFISRRLGRQAYQRLVQPLLCGIYCANGDQLSLAATFPELRKLERKHGSLIRGLQQKSRSASSLYPPFVTLPNGMGDLISAVRQSLQKTQVNLSTPVIKAKPGKKAELLLDGQSFQAFDAVLFTTPSFIVANCVKESLPELSGVLEAIPHVSTASVNLWYRADQIDHELNGYGFVVPSDQQDGLTAVTWTSSKHYDRAPDHLRLIRAFVGREGAELLPETSDEEILECVQRELRRTMNLRCVPTGYLIKRWHKGSPQYTLGHLDRLEQIDSHLKRSPGLYVCGSSYRGVGIPDCIREAKATAVKICEFLS